MNMPCANTEVNKINHARSPPDRWPGSGISRIDSKEVIALSHVERGSF